MITLKQKLIKSRNEDIKVRKKTVEFKYENKIDLKPAVAPWTVIKNDRICRCYHFVIF